VLILDRKDTTILTYLRGTATSSTNTNQEKSAIHLSICIPTVIVTARSLWQLL